VCTVSEVCVCSFQEMMNKATVRLREREREREREIEDKLLIV